MQGNLGWYEYAAGHLTDAISADKEALTLKPQQKYIEFNLALCYAVQGKTAAARSLYLKTRQGATAADIAPPLAEIEAALKKQPHSDALREARAVMQPAPAKPVAVPAQQKK